MFSTTCANYSDYDGILKDEDTQQTPLNAYGASKCAIEKMLANFAASDGLQSVTFHDFNVAGTDPDAQVSVFHHPETPLISLILDAVQGRSSALSMFSTGYSNADVTCLYDYVPMIGLRRLKQGLGMRITALAPEMVLQCAW